MSEECRRASEDWVVEARQHGKGREASRRQGGVRPAGRIEVMLLPQTLADGLSGNSDVRHETTLLKGRFRLMELQYPDPRGRSSRPRRS